MSPNHRNWADLPTELLGLFLDKLVLLPDYIRFGAVCKGWRSAARENHEDRRRTCYQQPPLLLLPLEPDDERHRRLYSIWEQKSYPQHLTLPRTYEFSHTSKLCGSSYGWLVLADESSCPVDSFFVTLFNPFAEKVIQLPPVLRCLRGYPEAVVDSIKLSCDPCLNPYDWVSVAIYGEDSRLALMRAGQDAWYYVRDPIEDVIAVGFYQGRLYAMIRTDFRYELFRITSDDDAGFGSVKRVKQLTEMECDNATYVYSKFYLVELEGQLLLVRRRYSKDADPGPKTFGFYVYKFNLKEEETSAVNSGDLAELIELQGLGEFSLFLGGNKPFCIPTATFPNCRPNCIYYTTDNKRYDPPHSPPYDGFISDEVDEMGVFDLASGEMSQYHTLPPSQLRMPPAVWISGSLG